MSWIEFTGSEYWAGRPVAYKIADAEPRGRLVVTGTIAKATTMLVAAAASYHCVIEDGTGQLDLIFLGQRHVLGLVVGALCTVEGTARSEGGRLVVWNPIYRLETLDLDWE